MFKERKKEDLILAIFVTTMIITTFILLKPSTSNQTDTISAYAIKDGANLGIGFAIIMLAIIILIVGFLLGFKQRKKDEIKQKFDKTDEKKIITNPLPVFEENAHQENVSVQEIKKEAEELEKMHEDIKVKEDITPAVISGEQIKEELLEASSQPHEEEIKVELPVIEKKPEETLKEAPPEKQFYLHNGGVIKSIPELKEKIKIIPEEVFNFHVSDDHNHFADWVVGVFHDEGLGQRLRNAKNKSDFQAALNN